MKFIPNSTSDRNFAIGLTVLFLLIGSFVMFHHELWRDEVQAWMLARATRSFQDIQNYRYEPFFGIWEVTLLLLTRFTSSTDVLQAFHLSIAATNVFLFTKYSPFTRVQKFLFSFGYFTFYEYGIISRQYVFGLLSAILFCLAFKHRYTKFYWIVASLLLMSRVSIYTLILAIAISAVLSLEFYYRTKKNLLPDGVHYKSILIGLGVIVVGIITSIYSCIPPQDSGYAMGWYFTFHPELLSRVASLPVKALFPVPQIEFHFWNSYLLDTFAFFLSYKEYITALLLLWTFLVLFRTPWVLGIYLVATFGILAFSYVKFPGVVRHHGILFVIFMLVVWGYRCSKKIDGQGIVFRFSKRLEKSLNPALIAILVGQIFGTLIAVNMDVKHVFSYGRQMAEYIQNNKLSNLPIIAHRDAPTSTVAAYLKPSKLFYLSGERYGSFIRFDQKRLSAPPPLERVIQIGQRLTHSGSSDFLILLNRPLPPAYLSMYSLNLLVSFNKSIVSDESYWLYIKKSE